MYRNFSEARLHTALIARRISAAGCEPDEADLVEFEGSTLSGGGYRRPDGHMTPGLHSAIEAWAALDVDRLARDLRGIGAPDVEGG